MRPKLLEVTFLRRQHLPGARQLLILSLHVTLQLVQQRGSAFLQVGLADRAANDRGMLCRTQAALPLRENALLRGGGELRIVHAASGRPAIDRANASNMLEPRAPRQP